MNVIIKQGEPKEFESLSHIWSASAQSILLIDDPSLSLLQSKYLSDAVTCLRHKNVSVFMTIHRLFGNNSVFRRTLCNFQILLLMSTRRLVKDAAIVDSQQGLDGSLKAVFSYVLSSGKFRYLLVDTTPACPESCRFRVYDGPNLKILKDE